MDNQNTKSIPPQSSSVAAVIIFFILLFIFAKWGPAINFSTTTQTKGQPFIVEGTGKIYVTPDIAKVTVGITKSGSSLTKVQDEVNRSSQALTNQLKNLGIAENDIKTTSYNIYPQYDYTSPSKQITGYEVSTNYEVTIRDFDKVNQVLAVSTGAGANVIGNVNFDLSDSLKKQKTQEAMTNAVAEAKDKASELAKAAGITLGPVINVSEVTNQPNIVPMMNNTVLTGGGGEDKSITPPNVQAGQTEIDVTVSVSYDIR
jgi:uncharacterized protein YggE